MWHVTVAVLHVYNSMLSWHVPLHIMRRRGRCKWGVGECVMQGSWKKVGFVDMGVRPMSEMQGLGTPS